MYHQEARFYQLVKQRGHLSQEDEADYLRLLTGLEGEARVAQVIQDLGLAAFYLTDLWIPLGKGTQIDGLLLMPQGLYLIEIKHYGGQFLYQGFASRLNGRPYQHDLLGQSGPSSEPAATISKEPAIRLSVSVQADFQSGPFAGRGVRSGSIYAVAAGTGLASGTGRSDGRSALQSAPTAALGFTETTPACQPLSAAPTDFHRAPNSAKRHWLPPLFAAGHDL